MLQVGLFLGGLMPKTTPYTFTEADFDAAMNVVAAGIDHEPALNATMIGEIKKLYANGTYTYPKATGGFTYWW